MNPTRHDPFLTCDWRRIMDVYVSECGKETSATYPPDPAPLLCTGCGRLIRLLEKTRILIAGNNAEFIASSYSAKFNGWRTAGPVYKKNDGWYSQEFEKMIVIGYGLMCMLRVEEILQ